MLGAMTTVFGYHDPGEQAWMVLDETRTRAFGRAITDLIEPDDVVLDIGSGSGILSLYAARAGARKVYAVEASDAHALARAHVKENGFESIVEVLNVDLRDLDPALLDPKPTVIISEMLGHFAPDERMHSVYRLALRKLAAPGARVLPEAYRLCFALARMSGLDSDLARLRDVDGLSLGSLAERLQSRPTLTYVSPEELLTEEAPTEWIAPDAPRPPEYRVQLPTSRAAKANAIVISFEARLAPGHVLGTRVADPRTHWKQVILPLVPGLDISEGSTAELAIRPRLVSDRGTWAWQASFGAQQVNGDAMNAVLGGNDLASVARQLGLRLKDPETFRRTPTLLGWQAVLGGDLESATIDTLAERLFEAQPDRFADREDARQAVMYLLRVTGAL